MKQTTTPTTTYFEDVVKVRDPYLDTFIANLMSLGMDKVHGEKLIKIEAEGIEKILKSQFEGALSQKADKDNGLE